MPTTDARGASDDTVADPALWSPGKRNRYAWMITLLLTFLMMLNWADKAVMGLAAVPIMKEMGITPGQFGLVSSGMFLAFTVSQLLVAPLSTKLPSRWLILAMCGIWAVSNLPVVIFATLPALWVSRLLLGVGEGPYAPLCMHSVYKWFPTKRGATPAAIASSGVTIGIVAFAPILAVLISSFGWKVAFLSLSGVGLLWALVWIVVGKDGPYTSLAAEREIEGPDAAEQSVPQLVEQPVPFLRSILNPTWFFAVLVSFFGYWAFALCTSWGPAYFETVLGYSRRAAGSMIALPAAWGFACTIALSNLTQRLDLKGVPTRWARGLVVGLAGLVAGTCLTVSTFVDHPGVALGLLSVGFGTAPALFAVTYLIVGELTTIAQRPAHLNVANAGLSMGGVVAPSVAGFLIGAASTPAGGYISAFRLTGVLLAAAGLGCLIFVNQQREQRKLGLLAHAVETDLDERTEKETGGGEYVTAGNQPS
ncbi:MULTISPECIES: MFS transporter [unclassified Luteococcus]|uniref:MFS transporter n=1 Tax=unclassified Luteococcus TaxID=2639923 RepID=UPI00313E06ED